MTSNILDIQNAIRLQSEDLRDELSELARWEEEVKAKAAAAKGSTSRTTVAPDLPPIRGTAPLKPAGAQPKREDPMQVCKEQGNEYFRKGNFSEAMRMYTKGIDVNPNNSAAHVLYANRAMCHLKLSQWEQAEKDATTCVQMNRAYAKGFFRRAVARKNLKKWKDARADLETVLVLTPGDDEVQDELAFVTQQLRQEEASAAAAAAAAAPKRKKLVIEEVDEDEDDEANGQHRKEASHDDAAERAATERARVEQQRVAEENAAQERKRQEQIAADAAARQQSRKANPRVEVVEEVEEVNTRASPPEPPKAAPPTPQQKTEAPSPPRSTSAAQPKGATTAPASARVLNVSRWTKETLRPPKSFLDFEKTYVEVRGNDELVETYLLLVPFANYKALFGSSITSEMVVDFVRLAKRREDVRLDIMRALGQVSRLGEIIMFFDASETALVKEVLELLKTSGVDVAKLQSQWS